MPEKREPGFYWVKLYEDWTIGLYEVRPNYVSWSVIGSDELYEDHHFDEIGKRVEERTR